MLIGLNFCFVALNGTSKCTNKKKTKKNNKQGQQETRPDVDSTAAAEAEEQGEAKGQGMEKQEATDAAASGMYVCVDASFWPCHNVATVLRIRLITRFSQLGNSALLHSVSPLCGYIDKLSPCVMSIQFSVYCRY